MQDELAGIAPRISHASMVCMVLVPTIVMSGNKHYRNLRSAECRSMDNRLTSGGERKTQREMAWGKTAESGTAWTLGRSSRE
jgi:hypothetical protein